VTARNTTVRCGHLSLSRVAPRNKTFLPQEQETGGRKRRTVRCEGAREGETPRLHRLLGASSCRGDSTSLLVRVNGSLPLSLSLFYRPLFSPHASRASFFISLYGLIPSFPRRARYICRLVSPSGSCLYHTATSPGPPLRRSPSKTVSPLRFMFPPTQRRIDPFLLSDVYVRGAARRGAAPPPPAPAPAAALLPTACARE